MTQQVMPADIQRLLQAGTVIPAHPLALNSARQLDEQRQRALTRYYMAAGVGGVAVGVHTTQFEIREPQFNLYEPVLALAAEEIDRVAQGRPFIKVAGVCGPTEQALREVEIAKKYGYHIALVSMGGLEGWSEEEHLQRIQLIAKEMPVFGFYLQPSVGGRVFSYNFWRQFVNIEGVQAIKIAPFNRYQTLDVMRAVCESERRDDIAMYTGNDDHIVQDLLTKYSFQVDGKTVEKQFVGGLLGHWACWTQKAVELFQRIQQVKEELATSGSGQQSIPYEWFPLAEQVTDTNAAFFDAANQFKGCIAGIHEVLRRQGLLEGTWCLNPDEQLSAGQMEEIDRVYAQYPQLNDDDFVKKHLHEWLQ